MRADAKVEGPRQSMSWLHTWASLILGWLLYAIFLTGTLSFFQTESSSWMKPEFHQSIPSDSQLENTQVALNYLQNNHPQAGSWSIQLPDARQNITTVTILKQGEDPRARRGGERIYLDSHTGEVLQARDTRGGSFLYRFHFELYGLPRIWARWIVGLATMLMLVAIVSGIITHKKIFKDFFTFRTGKGQRSWLDAHNATAVFTLPFHLMITFSGLLLLMFTFMPWGINQIYANRGEFLQDQRQALIQDHSQKNATAHGENPSRTRGENAENGTKRGDKKNRQENVQAAALTDLKPIVQFAQSEWKANSIGSISIIAPNTSQAKIEVRALHAVSVAHRNVYDSLEFDGVTGKNLTPATQLNNPSIANGIYNVTTVLHEGRGISTALRWLLFLSGIMGTLMVATGLILWCVKRAPQQQKQGYKSVDFRFVEIANITAIIGLPIACAAYFYANRLLPAAIDMRLNSEIRTFFCVWLLCFIYAAVRSHRQAWLELLMFASLAFAFLPVLNGFTGSAALWQSIPSGQWMIATFDLAMWFLAILFFCAYRKVKNHSPIPSKKAKQGNAQEIEN
ncbi:PepSY-associated TM helix domain-containing protein [Acinetobacter defluvii]|uniref:PepSY-associated TM helix domain-containing protein n=1 Tax=Acinetobacter defluvii TaxID=1871111 RepID=UPI003AF86D25